MYICLFFISALAYHFFSEWGFNLGLGLMRFIPWNVFKSQNAGNVWRKGFDRKVEALIPSTALQPYNLFVRNLCCEVYFYLRMHQNYHLSLLQIYCWVYQSKNFENQPISDKTLAAYVFSPPCNPLKNGDARLDLPDACMQHARRSPRPRPDFCPKIRTATTTATTATMQAITTTVMTMTITETDIELSAAVPLDKVVIVDVCALMRRTNSTTQESSVTVTFKGVITNYSYDSTTIRLRRKTDMFILLALNGSRRARYVVVGSYRKHISQLRFDYDTTTMRRYRERRIRLRRKWSKLRYDYDKTTHASIRYDSTRAKNEHVNFSS